MIVMGVNCLHQTQQLSIEEYMNVNELSKTICEPKPIINRMIFLLKVASLLNVIAFVVFVCEAISHYRYMINSVVHFGILMFLYFVWRFKKFSIELFGIDNIQIVGAHLDHKWRDKTWQTRKLSLRDWFVACGLSGVSKKNNG